jgi:hypothetical protein
MTAVQWLEKQYLLTNGKLVCQDFEYAEKLEKQEIIDAFDEGQEYEYQYHINNAPKFDSETYYQETFKS